MIFLFQLGLVNLLASNAFPIIYLYTLKSHKFTNGTDKQAPQFFHLFYPPD